MVSIHSYIQNEIDALTPNTSIRNVKLAFASHMFTHLAVEENGFLIGSISEDDVQAFEDEKTIADYRYSLDAFFVRKETNWLDVLEAFARNNANMMPVLDKDNKYIGYYDLIDIVALFKETPFLFEPGGILVIENAVKEYSFSEISQIVEGNNGKLLGAFISEIRDNIVQITLKIGNTGLNGIIQSFRRYNYRIVSGNEEDIYVEDLKERSAYLKKFLDM